MAFVKRICLAAAVLAMLAGCAPKPEARQPADPPAATKAPARVVPTPAPLARADILAATAAAASAYAAGEAYPEAAELAGRQFTVRLAIGCGQQDGGATVYDAKAGLLRFSIKPETWTDDPRVIGLAAESDTEAIEGFWVRWPWMNAEGCPRRPALVSEQAAQASTVGLVRLFGRDSSRLKRRGDRGYETTAKLEAAPEPGAYRLVISGRIADPADHRPVRCGSTHPDHRPTCLVVIEPDRVAIESAGGETVAEWAG